MKELKIGLIGCGGMAKNYREIYTKIKGARLDFVVGLDSDNPREAAQMLGASRYSTNYEDLINSDVDIVDISTPNHLHKEQFIKAVRAGKNVLLQKPIASTLDDAFEIYEESKKTDKTVGMYMSRHSASAYVEIKNIIESGAIEKISSVHARTSLVRRASANSAENWRCSVEKTGGGSLIQLGVHDYDILSWVLGSKISEIGAYCENIMSPHIGGDDSSQTIIKFENGVVGCVESSYCSKVNSFCVYGNEGTVIYRGGKFYMSGDNAYKGIIADYDGSGDEKSYPVSDAGKNLYRIDNPYEQHVKFTEAVIKGEKAPISVWKGVEGLIVVKAAYESSRTKSFVNIEEFTKKALEEYKCGK